MCWFIAVSCSTVSLFSPFYSSCISCTPPICHYCSILTVTVGSMAFVCVFCSPRRSPKYPSLKYNTPIPPSCLFPTLVFCTSFLVTVFLDVCVVCKKNKKPV
ncbi:hypothetical protein HOY82DRAFT_567707 [Tuber indicum]|nr:hypothetical protein HOY82DRAFT_567707 [Tuber indicum]